MMVDLMEMTGTSEVQEGGEMTLALRVKKMCSVSLSW